MNSKFEGPENSYVIYIWILLRNLHMNFIGKLHMNSNIARISSVSSQFEVQIRGKPEIHLGWCPICLEIQQKMNKKSFTKHVRHANFPGGAYRRRMSSNTSDYRT